MPIHNWKDRTIEVKAFTVPKMLWLTIGLNVFVDGKLSGSSPDRLEGLSTRVPFKIPLGEHLVDGCVESGKLASPLWMTYRVTVRDEEIASGRTVAKGWYLTYLVMLIIFFALFWDYLI